MGIGGGIFLIAVGAILAFAFKADAGWLDMQVVGWVLMLAGLAVLSLTLWFWRDRRLRVAPSVVEEARLAQAARTGVVPPDPPDVTLPPPPPDV